MSALVTLKLDPDERIKTFWAVCRVLNARTTNKAGAVYLRDIPVAVLKTMTGLDKFTDLNDIRAVLRAGEKEGLFKNTDGAWTMTASGSVYFYMTQFVSIHHPDVPRQMVEFYQGDFLQLAAFDGYASRQINATPQELRERGLIEFNHRTRILTLSDWCLPLGVLAPTGKVKEEAQ